MADCAPPHVEMRPYLEALIAGRSLTSEDARTIAHAVAHNTFEPLQLAALLGLLAARGESAEVTFAFASVMRSHAISVAVPDVGDLVDIVGTGGDGHDTVNISTAAAIVTAACGARVAKHGSISASSRSGSADVLAALGVAALQPAEIAACLQECGVAFMFAPLFHPAARHVVAVRKALKIRTIFNIMGPLLNPCGVRRALLGVYAPRLLRVYAEAVRDLGADHVLIVHCCGLDEIAPVGVTHALEVRGHHITHMSIDPTTFGVPLYTIADLVGGSPSDNAATLRRVLRASPMATESPDSSPGFHPAVEAAIALNTGAALYVAGKAASVAEGYATALAKMRSGDVAPLLERWALYTQRVTAARSSS